MGEEPANSDKLVDQYIIEWQRRFPEFRKSHQVELREFRSDWLSRFMHEFLLFRQKSTYDSLLQTMLTANERDLLHTDPAFTRAWQIFVDLCWLRKRAVQVGLVVASILSIVAAVFFFYLMSAMAFSSKH